jgi:hypothetical protein
VTTNDVGALEVVDGVAVAELDAVPVPAALIAETRKLYWVPFDNDVTVSTRVSEIAPENVLHVAPESEEYSAT